MIIAVLGGSFDPPHVGHAMMVQWILLTRQADKVVLVPSYDHPLGKKSSPFDLRAAWCRALADDLNGETPHLKSRVVVDEREQWLPRPSRTLHTLESLEKSYPGAGVRLVVGADILQESDRWHKWEEIEERFNPIVAGRTGYPPVDGAPTFPGVSSTEIRERIKDGKSVDRLIPFAVRCRMIAP